MFSGIVEHTVKARKVEKGKDTLRLYLTTPKNWKLSIGESINVDGICSTVEKIEKSMFRVYYMPETIRKTNLHALSSTHTYNLERSLTLETLIGGHLVSGHIDTTAEVKEIVKEKEARVVTFKISQEFSKYIIYKGSIAVNGVSLTIVSVKRNSFTVSLIPHTLSETNLGLLRVGDVVNIEVDLIAKYLEKLSAR